MKDRIVFDSIKDISEVSSKRRPIRLDKLEIDPNSPVRDVGSKEFAIRSTEDEPFNMKRTLPSIMKKTGDE
jgi:hypothetical protein